MRYFFVVLVLALAVDAAAQTTGKIAGRVTDAQGEPLIGVNVRIEGTTRGSSTDVEGRYFILNVDPGTYTVVASYLGFQTTRVEGVRVTVDRTTELDFVLQEETLGLDEVTVVADRTLVVKDRTSASAKVSGEQILALPVDNFLDTVALQAGVTRGSGGSLHIRGGRSSEIKYYVDGVAVSNPFTNSLAAPVENTAVQEVEVISGTFNAEFGQANSGIVNIVTKSGSDTFSGTFIGSVGGYVSTRGRVFHDIDEASLTGERLLEGSLSGPTFLDGLTFFLNTKYTSREGWLFGREVFLPSDSSDFSGPPSAWTIEASGDSSVVPMNPSTGLTGLGKLTYQLTPNLKVSYSLTRSFSRNKFYNHFYRLNPGFLPTQRSTSYNHLLAINHVLDNRTFYNLRLTAYTTSFTQYKYEDPTDPRYRFFYGRGNQPNDVFNTGGVDNRYLDRHSVTYAARFDVSRQFGNTHLVKAGIEVRHNILDFEEFELQVDPRQYGDLNPRIPPVSSNRHNVYRKKPLEVAAFLQDKIEIRDLIVNVGVRFDYFDANSVVPTDLRDPQNILRPRPVEEAYREAEPKYQVSPRLGFAFPITETGIIHASYGQFFQIPEFGRLYENPEFEVTLGSFNTFIGNADLDPQRSTVYEMGLQQQLGAFFVADLTMYYRDVRNLLGTGLYETYTGSDTYGRYENADFGNVRGITASLGFSVPEAGLRGALNYTYQSARGNGSDPQQAFFDAQGNNEATRVLIPLDWDQRHNLNADVTYSDGGWSAGVIGTFISGYPFTPRDLQRQPIVQLRNQARYAPEFFVDLRLARVFTAGPARGQLFLIAENVLDFYRDDRFPRLFQTEIQAHRDNGLARINDLRDFRYNPIVQPPPRQLRVGLQVDF
ncbi:MAG: TonB-dependent receptor [Bacteroidetes bacterium]|nr:MAG: TonB-dependent receptor [Bacteroidota bacterium]